MALTILHQPLAFTFAIFTQAEYSLTSSHAQLVMDPTRLESEIAEGRLTIVINKQGDLIHLCKEGGASLEPSQIYVDALGEARKQAALL